MELSMQITYLHGQLFLIHRKLRLFDKKWGAQRRISSPPLDGCTAVKAGAEGNLEFPNGVAPATFLCVSFSPISKNCADNTIKNV